MVGKLESAATRIAGFTQSANTKNVPIYPLVPPCNKIPFNAAPIENSRTPNQILRPA